MIQFIKKLPLRRAMILALAVCSLLTAVASVFIVGTTLALRVLYNGKSIAVIRDSGEFDNAVKLVTRTVSGANVADAVEKPIYTRIMVPTHQLSSEADVAEAIIANTDEIISAYALNIGGKTAVCVADRAVLSLCDEIRCRFDRDGNSVSRFAVDVSIAKGYFLQNELGSMDDARAALEAVDVLTEYSESRQICLPYKVQKTKTSSLLSGCTEVLKSGENGSASVTDQVTLKNGEEVARVETDRTVLQQPIPEILLVGVSHSTYHKKINSGFVFPLPKNGWVVTAWYGDGRNHRAIDIGCDAGTPIYSVKAGKVISACWDGDYGYAVVIDHGNGLQTRYAHVSQFFVTKGEWVSAGDQIAAVGQTGNATGNHLHFEVLVNGNRMNPAPYIGL